MQLVYDDPVLHRIQNARPWSGPIVDLRRIISSAWEGTNYSGKFSFRWRFAHLTHVLKLLVHDIKYNRDHVQGWEDQLKAIDEISSSTIFF